VTKVLKLGLIGDNIAQSQSPRMYQIAGHLAGIEVSYVRLVPQKLGMAFEDVFSLVQQDGFHGVNVTHPYKERASDCVSAQDPVVCGIGAVNTVIFSDQPPMGFNTDYSGFIRAYRTIRRDAAPGTVCLIGAGGVGRAIAFALLALKAKAIVCVDLDRTKAQALGHALNATGTPTRVTVSDNALDAARYADGIVNCTPLGMTNIGGTPLPAETITNAVWAFDAVYTPIETQFLQDARRSGLTVISGYELFLGQGIDAWAHFSKTELDPAILRCALHGDAL